MYLETLRMVTAWLKHEQYGVNAMLGVVPIDPVDNTPNPIATLSNAGGLAVFNEPDCEEVITKREPIALPALYVTSEDRITMSGEPIPDGQVRYVESGIPIVIRYITDVQPLTKAVIDGYYTLRAAAKSLAEFSKQVHEADRTRNMILIIHGTSLDYLPIDEAVGKVRASGAIIPTFHARDAAP